jgi:hypothetical protein
VLLAVGRDDSSGSTGFGLEISCFGLVAEVMDCSGVSTIVGRDDCCGTSDAWP